MYLEKHEGVLIFFGVELLDTKEGRYRRGGKEFCLFDLLV